MPPCSEKGCFVKTRKQRNEMVSRSCSAFVQCAKTNTWNRLERGEIRGVFLILQYLYLQLPRRMRTWFGFDSEFSLRTCSKSALNSKLESSRNWSWSDGKLFLDTRFSHLVKGRPFLFTVSSGSGRSLSQKPKRVKDFKHPYLKEFWDRDSVELDRKIGIWGTGNLHANEFVLPNF